jgi:general secretion pathway protein D
MYLKVAVVFALSALISACTPGAGPGLGELVPAAGADSAAKPASSANNDSDDSLRIRRVMELRQRYRGSSDVAGLDELQRGETEAATHFLAAGSALAREGRYQEAIEKYEMGLLAQPKNAELQQARQTAVGRKELGRLYAEGQRAKSVGNYDLAETLYQRAASFDGQNEGLKKELTDLDRMKKGEEQRFVLAAFRSQSPVAVNFRDAKLKDALQVVCEPYNLNFVFDKNADNLDVSVSARNVNFEQAFNMLLQAANAGYKVLGPNSIFIYEDTPDKRKQYADLYFKTFHLSTLKAERMAEILKSSMEIKTLVANNDLGTIQVRDTRDTLDVVDKLIAANDRKPAEVMLNVEVIEIDRNKSDQLGIDWGSQVSVTPPNSATSVASTAATAATTTTTASTVAGLTLQGLMNGAPLVNQTTLTLPTVTLNYLKSTVNARTLSNPRVRTVDGQPAKIHVGDRVPLQSASIQDATGQSRTMYEYHDIGIALDVIPKYHLDDSIFVDLNVEVSSLGQNLGSAAAPAYAIGTRNVHTTMILREAETAVLGGLISETEQHSLNGLPLPGLDPNGILGHLFGNHGDTGQRTELILTITPYLVRSQSLPGRSNTDFYSGTDKDYSTRAGYDYLKKAPAAKQPPRYMLTPDNKKPVDEAATKIGPGKGQPDSVLQTTGLAR